MPQRAGPAGHPFATLKDRHGYGGLLCRGPDLAGAGMGLSARAYSFTRAINLVGMARLLEAIRGRVVGSRGVAVAC